MKKIILEFLRRGLTACGLGPLVLVILYLILQQTRDVQTVTVQEVCVAIITLTLLAFMAGGLNVLYHVERLPLMVAVLIHGGILYFSYLVTYLLNGWLEWGLLPFFVFSAIFVIGYFAIWAIIYAFIKRKTEKLNAILKQKQQEANEL